MTDTFDPQKIKLSERQVECLTFIEQEYMLTGHVPTADRISEVFGTSKSTVRKWLDSPEFNYIMNTRGINAPKRVGVLTPQQLMIANMLLNPADRRSKREKCEEAGITVQRLSAWQRDPQFQDYMQRMAEKLFQNSDDEAYMNVVKNVQSGDLRAAQFYFEMTGKYQKSVRHDFNIDGFLTSLIEILQVRVQDAKTLELIADDIDKLMTGQPVDLSPVTELPSLPAAGIIEADLIELDDLTFSIDLSGLEE